MAVHVQGQIAGCAVQGQIAGCAGQGQRAGCAHSITAIQFCIYIDH